MAELINLRRVRKTRARNAAAEQAEANRIAFGRSKGEKRETAAAQARADRVLDGHRLEEEGGPSAPDPDVSKR